MIVPTSLHTTFPNRREKDREKEEDRDDQRKRRIEMIREEDRKRTRYMELNMNDGGHFMNCAE